MVGSATYSNAWAFFKKREVAGLKIPTKKAKTASTVAGSGGNSAAPTPDISKIVLDDEEERDENQEGNDGDDDEERDVDVFDTCDEIRKKINAHLMKPGVTQAQFCRNLTEQLHGTGKVATSQLTTFRSKKGPNAGATSGTFYAAYVFFEKVSRSRTEIIPAVRMLILDMYRSDSPKASQRASTDRTW